jgi:hypothetical protein
VLGPELKTKTVNHTFLVERSPVKQPLSPLKTITIKPDQVTSQTYRYSAAKGTS